MLVLLPASNEILPRSLSHMCAPSLSVKSFQDQKSYMKFRSICESFGHFKARARGICSALMEQHLQGPMVDGGAFHRRLEPLCIWMAASALPSLAFVLDRVTLRWHISFPTDSEAYLHNCQDSRRIYLS